MIEPLDRLTAGMAILAGGDRVIRVTDELAADFAPGDRLVVVGEDVLHIPLAESTTAARAVGAAADAFAAMGSVSDAQVTAFFEAFADRLADDATFAPVAAANEADIEAARARGRSTTRLVLSDTMRSDMIAGLRSWAAADSGRGAVLERVTHEGWSAELRRAGLGVVGFVFEGRPNVFADACGVIRSGNTVVFRIGSDALGTARAIVEHALDPALAAAGLPPGTASLVDSAAHAAGWAMFGDARLGLAVARGSGTAVTQLGTVARQAGVPVSLHGTGGAWLVADATADAGALAAAVLHSLDRKVCNTLNVCCIVAERAAELVPVVLAAVGAAADRRGTNPKLHVAPGAEAHVSDEWFEPTDITRAGGAVREAGAERIELHELGTEWEWEESPEISLVVVDDADAAVALFNAHSPRFVASLVSEDPAAHDRFYELVDAPFVGNGFTRWVDGQYALGKPELGLSNWQFGRLFGRGGVLSGDSVFTVRTRVTQTDPGIHR
ncbi:MAG: aldehyde dehydrogenase family protein [Acidimicrobiales bacterium]